MVIQEAASRDFPELMDFYNEMCEVLGQRDFLPEGNRGGFPSEEMVEAAMQSHGQFIGREDGRIVAAYMMNHDCDPAYQKATWQIAAEPEEVVVLHALRVLPRYEGRGFFRRMMEHAICTARARGQKAMRLDVLKGNDIPQRLYRSLGFIHVDTVDITYADIGAPMPFLLYELIL